MSDEKSCLVNRLSHYVEISEGVGELLAALEKNEREYDAGAMIHSGGDITENLYVVKSGWFFSYTYLPDGGRLVVQIHHPGDIIGFPGLAFDHQALDLISSTGGCLCPFAKSDLDVIFEQAPVLTALLFTLSARDHVIFIDRLRAVSRMHARPRIAYFLLDLVSRLRITNHSMTNDFRLPLTQSDIGDALGLTNVSVSRAMTKLEESGLIERKSGNVLIRDEESLKKMCDFEDRYAEMDTSWFPEA